MHLRMSQVLTAQPAQVIRHHRLVGHGAWFHIAGLLRCRGAHIQIIHIQIRKRLHEVKSVVYSRAMLDITHRATSQ